jgi:hypothetical protein
MLSTVGMFQTVCRCFPPTFSQKNPVRALQALFWYAVFKFQSIYAKFYQTLLRPPVSRPILRVHAVFLSHMRATFASNNLYM